MARRLKPDSMLFIATVVLVCVSLAWVYSASMGRAWNPTPGASKRSADPTMVLVKQMMFAALGLALLSIASRLDYRTYRNRYLMMVLVGATIAGLLAVFFFPAANGARRWIRLASAVTLQPSEFAKLVAVLVAAVLLAERVEQEEPLKPALVQIGGLLAVFGLLIFAEKDLGSVVIMTVVVGTLAFVAGMQFRHALAGLALTLPLAAIAIAAEPYRLRRVLAFFSGSATAATVVDPATAAAAFHTKQSLIAVGSGGTWGKGFTASVQKLYYLPFAHTDSIFAVIAEEVGLIGTTVVVACFAVIIWRGLRIAFRAPDPFAALLAVGVTTLIGFQAALNISVVLGLVPQKGVALPFVSSGGSSMLTSLVGMGILLNLSQHTSVTRDGA